MGGANIKSQFDRQNWSQVNSIGARAILQNKITLKQIQMHQTIEPLELTIARQSLKMFEWRRRMDGSHHIVKLYHYTSKQKILSSEEEHAAFTEIIHRLSQIPRISKAQGLLLIRQVIIALQTLTQLFGFFNLSIHMIGINSQGLAKVWLNENYAKNYVQKEHQMQANENSQLIIVNNLIRMIKTKVYNNELQGEYPFSMNFAKSVAHIDHLRQTSKDLFIDRIFLDRNLFNKSFSDGMHEQQKVNQALFDSTSDKSTGKQENGVIHGPILIRSQIPQISNEISIIKTNETHPQNYSNQIIQPRKSLSIEREQIIYHQVPVKPQPQLQHQFFKQNIVSIPNEQIYQRIQMNPPRQINPVMQNNGFTKPKMQAYQPQPSHPQIQHQIQHQIQPQTQIQHQPQFHLYQQQNAQQMLMHGPPVNYSQKQHLNAHQPLNQPPPISIQRKVNQHQIQHGNQQIHAGNQQFHPVSQPNHQIRANNYQNTRPMMKIIEQRPQQNADFMNLPLNVERVESRLSRGFLNEKKEVMSTQTQNTESHQAQDYKGKIEMVESMIFIRPEDE